MQPDQSIQTPPTPPPSTPIEYLNQISSKPKSKLPLTMKQLIILLALGFVVLLVAIIIIANILRPNHQPAEQLAAKLQTTLSVATAAQNTIQDSQLQAYNSNLTIDLTNIIRDIHAPLLLQGIDTNKLDPQVIAEESGTSITAQLENAKLDAVYDRTYADELSYQINLIMSSMQQLYSSTGSTSFKTFLQASYNNLSPIQKEFENFNAADD